MRKLIKLTSDEVIQLYLLHRGKGMRIVDIGKKMNKRMSVVGMCIKTMDEQFAHPEHNLFTHHINKQYGTAYAVLKNHPDILNAPVIAKVSYNAEKDRFICNICGKEYKRPGIITDKHKFIHPTPKNEETITPEQPLSIPQPPPPSRHEVLDAAFIVFRDAVKQFIVEEIAERTTQKGVGGEAVKNEFAVTQTSFLPIIIDPDTKEEGYCAEDIERMVPKHKFEQLTIWIRENQKTLNFVNNKVMILKKDFEDFLNEI